MLLLCFPRLGTNGLLPASGKDWGENSPSDARRFRSAVPWGKILAPLKSVAKKNLHLSRARICLLGFAGFSWQYLKVWHPKYLPPW